MLSKICILAALIAACSASAISVKSLGNTVYYFSSQEVTFLQAWAYCKNAGYKFASVTSGAQHSNLEKTLEALGASNASFWFGGIFLRNGFLNKWYWVDGLEEFSDPDGNAASHASTDYDSCVIFNYSGVTKKGTGSAGPCTDKRYFVCEI